MAIKRCPECGGMLSGSAGVCPHCGFNAGARRSLLWAAVLIVVIPGAGLLSLLSSEPSAEPARAVAPAPAKTHQPIAPVEPAELLLIPADYKGDVAQMLNLLSAQHPPCQADLQPVTAAQVKVSQNPANPEFTVVCGEPKKVLVHFTWLDAVNKKIPAQPAPPVVIGRAAAADACEAAAKQRASRPGSVDMSRVWSAAFQERPDGSAVYQSTFKAGNAFGVMDEFEITCHFNGLSLAGVNVTPAR